MTTGHVQVEQNQIDVTPAVEQLTRGVEAVSFDDPDIVVGAKKKGQVGLPPQIRLANRSIQITLIRPH